MQKCQDCPYRPLISLMCYAPGSNCIYPDPVAELVVGLKLSCMISRGGQHPSIKLATGEFYSHYVAKFNDDVVSVHLKDGTHHFDVPVKLFDLVLCGKKMPQHWINRS